MADRQKNPFGHGQDRFFWPLLVAVGLFVAGSVFSIYEGVAGVVVHASGYATVFASIEEPGLAGGVPYFGARRRGTLGQTNKSTTYDCSRAWQKRAAEDERAPHLAEDIDRQANETLRAAGFAHPILRTTAWITGAIPYSLGVDCEPR